VTKSKTTSQILSQPLVDNSSAPHDETLIDGADHACHVEIDEATNTSRVTMRSAGAD